MSDSQEQPWSDNPNAPNIPYWLYSYEKSYFAGTLISSMLHGITIVVFFQCMAALFDPVHRRGERIKWGLVSYITIMFSLATVQTALTLDIQSISYIDKREFPGVEDLQIPPGPFGYEAIISAEALTIVPSVAPILNNWLADGLLLYRCYFIYSKKFWVIAFPCLMFLSSMVMGIIFVYQATGPTTNPWAAIPYFSISLSLNVLLTLMIVIRLTLHARGVRTAMGGIGSGGLCKAIVTMFVESCAVNAVTSVLVLGLFGAGNDAMDIFLPILPRTQVLAPLFIIHRVANKSALTSKSLVSGHMSTFKARSRGELTDGGGDAPGEDSTNSVDERGMNASEPEIGVETTNDSHREEVY